MQKNVRILALVPLVSTFTLQITAVWVFALTDFTPIHWTNNVHSAIQDALFAQGPESKLVQSAKMIQQSFLLNRTTNMSITRFVTSLVPMDTMKSCWLWHVNYVTVRVHYVTLEQRIVKSVRTIQVFLSLFEGIIYFNYGNKCLQKCPDGFYGDPIDNTCKICH